MLPSAGRPGTGDVAKHGDSAPASELALRWEGAEACALGAARVDSRGVRERSCSARRLEAGGSRNLVSVSPSHEAELLRHRGSE